MKKTVGLCLLAGTVLGCVYQKELAKEFSTRDFIVGKISECDQYAKMHPRFAKAFEFLKRPDLAKLPVGRYEIDGDNIWAFIVDVKEKPFGDIQTTETHRTYIDIQAPLSGPETIGFLTATDDLLAKYDFNVEKDYVLFQAKTKPVTFQPGEFAIFIPPYGAHAPGLSLDGEPTVRKLVIKIRK